MARKKSGGRWLACILLLSCRLWCQTTNREAAATGLRTRIEASPTLALHAVALEAKAPRLGWESGAISGLAIDRAGRIYEIQRGEKADPILVLDAKGNVLRSWGAGNYRIPHGIRIDPEGNIWTVDAGSSTVIKYSAAGRKLLTIAIGDQPDNGNPFNGATDLAFGPARHIFITDGYGNARVVEYSASGKKLKQWGTHGIGPGQFNLPHAIQIDSQHTIYVADRENGRIEEFDLDGHFLKEIPDFGRIYSFKTAGSIIWATMGPLDQPAGSAGGWLVKLDSETGKLLGHLDIPQARAGHALDLTPSGDPIITAGNGLLWFQPDGVAISK